jgi:hypothetical protein
MAIYVYGYRKPTLEVNLMEGGSLAPNTTYYLCGYMRGKVATYQNTCGPLSDVVSFTTTGTAKSITINHKTYRDITAFSDAGGGLTLCTSARHCLRTGDTIKIASGSYAGTYTITWVSYSTFTIVKAYIDNVPVQCYSDSATYNNGYGMCYYMHTVNPMATGKFVYVESKMSDREYTAVYHGQDVLVTSAFNLSQNNRGNLEMQGLVYDGLFSILKDYGSIWVNIDTAETFSSIHIAIQSSGFVYNSFYSVLFTSANFLLVGSLWFTGSSGGAINESNVNITLVYGEFRANYPDRIVLSKSLMNLIVGGYMPYIYYTGTDCYFYTNSISNNFGGWVFGTENYLMGAQYFSTANKDTTIVIDGVTYYIDQNKTFDTTTVNIFHQRNYMVNIIKDCTIKGSIYEIWNQSEASNKSHYWFERVYIKKTPTKGYHFIVYDYKIGQFHNLKFLNINTDESDNRKILYKNVANTTAGFHFYRRLNFYIKTQAGVAISSASISITDNASNSYSGSTDVNGYCNIDIKEQYSEFPVGSLINTYAVDTFYSAFVIVISKAGYETERIFVNSLYGNETLNISLHKEVTITSLSLTHCTAIGENDGQIAITAGSGTAPYQYKVNDEDYQSENTFSGLAPGDYTVYVKDANDNVDSIAGVNITEPEYESFPYISSIELTHCSFISESDGSILITGTGLNTPVEYSIDGLAYQESGLFEDLSAGEYSAYIRDSRGNVRQTSEIDITEPGYESMPVIDSVEIVACTEVGSEDGSIEVTASGLNTPIEYSLDGITYQAEGLFDELIAGTYHLYVKDSRDNVSEMEGIEVTEPQYEYVYRDKNVTVDIEEVEEITVDIEGINLTCEIVED